MCRTLSGPCSNIWRAVSVALSVWLVGCWASLVGCSEARS